ncbi:hypothetical protein MTO96_027137 [Rhipicephalus appendiculatus]
MGAIDDDSDTEGGAILMCATGMCGAIVVRTIEDGREVGGMGLGRGGVPERWHVGTDLDIAEDGNRDGGRGADVTIVGLCALDVNRLDTGRVARDVETTLLADDVEEIAGDDVLGVVVAVVRGRRSSRGEIATDDVTIELLFGAECITVEIVEPILENDEDVREPTLDVAWCAAVVTLEPVFDVACTEVATDELLPFMAAVFTKLLLEFETADALTM